jgi:hypothetical protein
MRALAIFTVDSVEPDPPQREIEGVSYGRVVIKKTFRGDVDGHGSVEMLACRSEAGAGYVALEHIDARVGGCRGTFGLLHLGTMANGEPSGQWPIVPGSGTGELRGIKGEGRIDIATDGTHTFTLDYELAVAPA